MTQLIWFRHDLRTIDQPALSAAMEAGGDVRGVCLRTPARWQRHGWGPRRVQWYDAHVDCLKNDLAALGIELDYLEVSQDEDLASRIHTHAIKHGATALHHGLEAGLDERRLDQKLHGLLRDEDIQPHPVSTETILPTDAIFTKSNRPFRVFTPFRKAWDLTFADLPTPEAEAHKPQVATANPIGAWKPGSHTAMHRLHHFLEHGIEHYHHHRDRPDLDGTSSLSPWLAVGALSPMTCLKPLIRQYGLNRDDWPEGPRTWRDELVWREFYRHVMRFNDHVSMGQPLQAWTEHVAWRTSGSHFESWCAGETGVDIIDAAMRQLMSTGWMHNRLRMIVAMYLTKNLLVDWRLGESFFSSQLIDYDFASNNGGWQWSASTGTDAAPYFRVFNPESQADKCDPDSTFRSQWLADRAASPPAPDLRKSRAAAIDAFRAAKEKHAAGTSA